MKRSSIMKNFPKVMGSDMLAEKNVYIGSAYKHLQVISQDDEKRLERSMKREKKQPVPNYDEVCRRFLADQKDFSEENIQRAGITKRFSNNGDRQLCMDEVAEYIIKS